MGVIERIVDWPHTWQALTAAVAVAALGLSFLNWRRLDKMDKKVRWELVDADSQQSFYLRNHGPADALNVVLEFVEGMEPLSRGPLQHAVVHEGSQVWVGDFAPQSRWADRTRIRVTWKGGPKHGWSTQL